MKRLIAALLAVCALVGSAQAQVRDFEQILQSAHENNYKPILERAHPDADSLAFAKVRARMDSIRQYRPTVGLVLAGGGARGLAHLGVIKYMEELGIPGTLSPAPAWAALWAACTPWATSTTSWIRW